MTWLAFFLAVVAGIVDVSGYIALGGIFTAHVSGDTVKAADAVAHGAWGSALRYFAPTGWALYGLIACLTFAMGVQNSLLRSVDQVPVRTTFVTGMVVSFAHELLDWIFARFKPGRPDESGQRAALFGTIWLCFAIGGAAGGFLQVVRGAVVFVIPAIAMAALALYAWRRPFACVEPGI